jgi:hypothetical protein
LRLSDCLTHLCSDSDEDAAAVRVTGLDQDTAAMSAPHTDQKLRASIGANVLVQGKGDCHTPTPRPPPFLGFQDVHTHRARVCVCVCVHVHTISHHAQTVQPCATQRCWMGGGDQLVVAMG